MSRSGCWTTLAAAVLTVLSLTTAHAAAPIDDPESAVVEELLVVAKLPGPAWWRVSDGDTIIDIMGLPGPLPAGQDWDRSVLKHRLDGANLLILPPTGKAGLGDIPAILSLRGQMKSKTPLDATLPAPLEARLVAAARSVGKPPRAYQKWKPLAAGLQLMGDFTRAAKLKPDEPLDSIKAMARLAGVKMRPTGVYPAIPVARQIVKGYAPEAGLTCLEEAVNAVESGAEPIHTTSAAWARGDVRAAVRDARGEERCFYALPGVADLRRHAIKEEADVLQNALNTPGHAVAVLSLRSLVTQGGILEQLRARGVTVTSPTR